MAKAPQKVMPTHLPAVGMPDEYKTLILGRYYGKNRKPWSPYKIPKAKAKARVVSGRR